MKYIYNQNNINSNNEIINEMNKNLTSLFNIIMTRYNEVQLFRNNSPVINFYLNHKLTSQEFDENIKLLWEEIYALETEFYIILHELQYKSNLSLIARNRMNERGISEFEY